MTFFKAFNKQKVHGYKNKKNIGSSFVDIFFVAVRNNFETRRNESYL